MEKKFSNRANRSVFSRENTLVNTFKFAANVTMAMLFVTFFASCTQESLELDPTAAQSLMADSTSQKGLGWHHFTAAATAVDKSGKTIAANLSIRYEGDKTTYVDSEEELGLPVTMAFEDGNTFKTTDGITINRTENHSGNAVIGVYGGNFSGGFLGARLEDASQITQVCYVQLADSMSIKANDMPAKFASEWKAKKVSVVECHRIWRKPAAPTYEPMYRLIAEYVESEGGNSYYDIFAQKSEDGGKTWTEVDKYIDFAAISFGTWKPNVPGTLLVNSYDFQNGDYTEAMEKEQPRKQVGASKKFRIENTSKIQYFWSAVFNAPADASGQTDRNVGGTLNVWSRTIFWETPEGKEVFFAFEGKATTSYNAVDQTTGIYKRIVEISCNELVVDTQPGTVQLELVK